MEPKLAPGRFYGDVIKSHDAAGLTLTESAYSPAMKIPWHSHERAYFCIVLQGGYTESYGRNARTCHPLTIVFHPEGEMHADQFHQAGGRLFDVEMEPQWLERTRRHSALLDSPMDCGGGLPAWLAMRLYGEFQEIDAVSPLAMEGLVLEILAETCRRSIGSPEARAPRWLRQARDILHARFAETLTLEEIARSVGVHPMHLVRVFRRHYRCTVGDYVRRLRVEFASREISASDASLVEIALAAGFSDQSQFSKTFKQYTGMTASHFRQITRLR